MWTSVRVGVGVLKERRAVQVKKAAKLEGIPGLSIPQPPKSCQFRTKASTLVAEGYEKVGRKHDGVVYVYFKESQVRFRNLTKDSLTQFHSKDDASVRFSAIYEGPSVANIFVVAAEADRYFVVAAAADLYVDGVPIYNPAL